jgi:hypothetical protein
VRRRWVGAAVMAAGFAAVTAMVTLPADAAESPIATTVKLEATGAARAWNNPAWFQNQIDPLPPGNLASAKALHPRITRIWVSPDAFFKDGSWTFERLYPVFDQATQHSRQVLANVLPCYGLFDSADPSVCLGRIEAGLKHYKQRYPQLEFVEMFNELEGTMTGAQNYAWYRRGADVVARVNAELQPATPIKVGGPSTGGFSYCPDTGTGFLRDFLAAYAADRTAGKRLDFLSYHSYNLGQKQLDACGKPVFPPQAAQQKSMLQALLGRLGLPTTIPIYVTETGVFGGPNTGTTTDGKPNSVQTDQLVQAAGMATLDTQYTLGGMDATFHWVFNHNQWDRKSMFVDGVDDVVLPYYNVVRMQSMLKERLLTGTTVSTPLENGRGINVLATVDGSGLAAMLTNYQAFDRTKVHSVTVDPGTLPWTGRRVRVDRYLVNATTSNYNADPARSQLQRVESFTLAAGALAKRTLTLLPNAVTLLIYTPLPLDFETEKLPTVASGGTEIDISDSAASGGALNKFIGTGVGGRVTYTITVPKAGDHSIELRVKKTPERGVMRVDVDGATIATVDGYDDGYPFVDVDLGGHRLSKGTHTVTFVLTGTRGTGWTIGVDRLRLTPS